MMIRAIARRCRILVMDEATSSVDPETDALIQRIIQTRLAGVTVSQIVNAKVLRSLLIGS